MQTRLSSVSKKESSFWNRWSRQQPELHQPELARALDDLGRALGEQGRVDQALVAAERSVALYRELAKNRPGAFRVFLARSLVNLGKHLHELKLPDSALQITREAEALCRLLVSENPLVFASDLATCLNNLGNHLSELGHPDEALEATQEATVLYRGVALDRPLILPDFADSLGNLGIRLAEHGRTTDALQALDEAMETFHRLDSGPKSWPYEIAMLLVTRAETLTTANRFEEARADIDHAVERLRELDPTISTDSRLGLARALGITGDLRHELGNWRSAITALEESASLYHQLALEAPGEFDADLADILHDLSVNHSERGDWAESMRTRLEATKIYRRLALEQPFPHALDLICALDNSSLDYCAQGLYEKAVETSQESVQTARKLAKGSTNPLPELAESLHHLANALREGKRPEEALRVNEEEVSLFRRLAEGSDGSYLPGLATALHNRGVILGDLRRWGDAVLHSQQAMELYELLEPTESRSGAIDRCRENLAHQMREASAIREADC